MYIKPLFIFSFLILFYSCKKTQDANLGNIVDDNTSGEITKKDLTDLDFIEFALDSKTEKLVTDWQGYFELQNLITNVKNGDLSFFNNENNDEIKVLIEDLKSGVPLDVKSSSTSARILALETKLYKLESLSTIETTNKKELVNGIKEFLASFSNLNFQMNKKVEKDSREIIKP